MIYAFDTLVLSDLSNCSMHMLKTMGHISKENAYRILQDVTDISQNARKSFFQAEHALYTPGLDENRVSR